MTQVPLAPPPQTGQPIDGWLFLLWKRINSAGQILWSYLDFTGSNLTDIATRNHADLQNIDTASYTHLTATNATDLTDGGDSTLHYHATDRARANHSGTQTASTISDFDTEVSNNADVAANTSARHSAVTVSDTTSVDLTLTGQQISAVVLPAGVSHSGLADLNSTTYYHLTQANHTDLTDGGDSTLHYHSTDRDSANFTGTNWTDLTDAGATTLHKHDHGGMDGLGDDDHSQYLLAAGSRPLSADWDAGSFEIRAQTFESDVTTGTAPLVIASTTKVSNLNADLLDDQSGVYYLDSTNFTGANWTDLTDAGDSTLHYHATDRNADNHTSGSTNKVFTATEQTKLAGIETGAEVNNISDVNATDLTDGGATSLHTHQVTGTPNVISTTLTVAAETSYVVIDHLTVSGTLTVSGLVAII